MDGQYLSPQEVANRIGLSRSWVYEAIRNGKLPAMKLGHQSSKQPVLVAESDLYHFLAGEKE